MCHVPCDQYFPGVVMRAVSRRVHGMNASFYDMPFVELDSSNSWSLIMTMPSEWEASQCRHTPDGFSTHVSV